MHQCCMQAIAAVVIYDCKICITVDHAEARSALEDYRQNQTFLDVCGGGVGVMVAPLHSA
jgi:hypothetical protein